MPAIEVNNLSKDYEVYHKTPGFFGSVKDFVSRKSEKVAAVSDISFTLNEGELVGFLGPNGAGKTTTLKMLSGILQPSSGSMSVIGYNPSKRPKEYRMQFSLVMGQKSLLLPDLPAWESFVLHRSIYEIPKNAFSESIEELIELLDIRSIIHVPVRKLSLGQRMRCELAASLVHRPKVLFLDEPTIGLDVVAQKHIREFLKKYNKEKKTTVLLTSHYMEDIKELCDRVVIINHGKIAYDGTLAALIERFAPYKVLQVTFEKPGIGKGDVERFGVVTKFDPFACTIKVSRGSARHVASKLLSSDLPVDDILIDEIPVDDVVRQMFTKIEG